MNTELKDYPDYLDALLRGDRARCHAIVSELVTQEIEVKTLYESLFQRSLYEIGELWARNEISVDVEHYATAITESLLPLIYPQIFMADHIGRRAVVSCVANEHHQIGGKMVADVLEMNGWDTVFLGAGSSTDILLAEIGTQHPDLVALSVSIAQNMPSLEHAVEAVKTDYPDLPVIVGGQGFRHFAGTIPDTAIIRSLNDMEEYIGAFR